ncbi:hypothetical protein HELRODRAFT_64527, partial [Helobdella robusta]|uniref:Peptidase metallopeptidase domain-containing protein n=1 Tax=Helobdella robusta TaxID=6412 RepID=T1FXW0_HELRO
WTDVTRLEVENTVSPNDTNIKILFASGDHGDGFPFDGRSNGNVGKTLAHSFYPQDGRIHFDEDEEWTDESYEGTTNLLLKSMSTCHNLLRVATHEIGHVLGLNHSSKENDVMYAIYSPYDPNFNLTANDILRIQQLYGQ